MEITRSIMIQRYFAEKANETKTKIVVALVTIQLVTVGFTAEGGESILSWEYDLGAEYSFEPRISDTEVPIPLRTWWLSDFSMLSNTMSGLKQPIDLYDISETKFEVLIDGTIITLSTKKEEDKKKTTTQMDKAQIKKIITLVLKAVAVSMSVTSITLGITDAAGISDAGPETRLTLIGIGLFTLSVAALQEE